MDVQHIAKLARLHISGEEEKHMEEQMVAIVKMVEYLPALEEASVLLEPDNLMQLREDEAQPSYPKEEILQNAPEVAKGCFVAPKTAE